ncbi:MAG: translation initiation factor 2 [Acetivibrio sp.]
MKGKILIKVRNDRTKYEFTLRRNITVIKGDSATGKTTLIEMIHDFNLLGKESGVELSCSHNCIVVEGNTWKQQLVNVNQSVVFIDEGNRFVSSKEFASAIKRTDNYYVLVTRESLSTLPYSVKEIYGIRSKGKYGGLKQTYNELFQIYGRNSMQKKLKCSILITEDSNSGFQFFKSICEENKVNCIYSSGKSNIYKEMLKYKLEDVLVIADGAAFGPEMEGAINIIKRFPNISLCLPESFEWLILRSDCLDDADVRKMSNDWANYIDSRKFFSWEQFFCDLLIQKTQGTYLQYNKKNINPVYLDPSIRSKIMDKMESFSEEYE